MSSELETNTNMNVETVGNAVKENHGTYNIILF